MDEMFSKDSVFSEEEEYLSSTLEFLKAELGKETGILAEQRSELINANRLMWEDTPHKKVTTETVSYLDYFLNTARTAEMTDKQIQKYSSMLSVPYFGRFDFTEDGYDDVENIYIGYYNLMDTKKSRVYVYDWRAPISSIYYRFELGDCFYQSPQGKISGSTALKRQYQIEKGCLKSYFDSSIAIRDEILIMALSQSASRKMKNIVETIQKEQDLIIRDMSHHTLIVQGIAGSGKTSVALHRVAYLLYENEQTKLTRDNIMIISPNSIFSDYIDSVLPSLGEETVEITSLDIIYRSMIKGIYIQPRNKMLEASISEQSEHKRQKRLKRSEYLGSEKFMSLISKFAKRYERKIHKFSDVCVGNKIIFTRQQLKALFLDNKAKLPVENRLNRIYKRIMETAEPYFDEVQNKYKPLVYDNQKLRFEEEEHIQSVMAKYRANFEREIRNQLEVAVMRIYKQMLLAETSEKKVKNIFSSIAKSIDKGFLPFDAAAGALYLKLLICGDKRYSGIRHTIIDEAQDYYPLHYHIFSRLFQNSKFTVLGDINQSLEKDSSSIYDIAGGTLSGESGSVAYISLTKSYRSSLEISSFTSKILNSNQDYEAVERSGEKPRLSVFKSHDEMMYQMKLDIKAYSDEGYKQIAVITKTLEQARNVGNELYSDKNSFEYTVLGENKHSSSHIINGVNVMPVYMAKGLEFDVALIYDASSSNYNSVFDKSLLYVACTRALHKLSVYACESMSCFLPKP